MKTIKKSILLSALILSASIIQAQTVNADTISAGSGIVSTLSIQKLTLEVMLFY